MPDETVQSTAVQDNTAAAVDTTPVDNTVTQSTAPDAQQPAVQPQTQTQQQQPTAPQGAPDQYTDFTLPEGFTAPVDAFKDWAKSQNMTQEAAQSAVDFYVKNIVPQQQAAIDNQVQAWVKESETKYGKDGIEAANKALGRFITPEFKQFLADSGLGNHPEMIGVFKKINDQISESNMVEGQSNVNRPKSLGELFYPNMK